MLTIDVMPTEPKNVTPMTEDEARVAVDEIHSRVKALRQKLVELYRRQGWKALGYATWKEFSEGEFKRDRRNSYYLVEAAEVEGNLIESGIEPRKIFHVPDSQLRAIGEAPITLQKKAFEQLLEFQKVDGRVTAKDAEAAVASVYPNASLNKAKALCLLAIKNGAEIPNHNRADAIYEYWEKKKKPVDKRMKDVLRESIEIYLEEAFPQSDEEESDTASANNSTDPELSEALEIVSFLKEFQPETVARVFRQIPEEYQVVTMLRLVLSLDKETVSTVLKDEGIEIDDIKKLADDCESLCLHLDKVF
jgi:hypothetical protein